MRFVAAIDTIFYGAAYGQGSLVDTVGWSRKQLLQFLDKGLISPADLNGHAVREIKLSDLGDISEDPGTEGQTLVRKNGRWTPTDAAAGSNDYVDQVLAAHINSSAPHPTYDDLPSLVLVFENGLA